MAESHGDSLHAATRVDGGDVERLEALVRDAARPALAQGRLETRGDGKVEWTQRKPWRDGTRAIVFDPLTFSERLAALVPHPREHCWTDHGSLAPASSLRNRVVPRAAAARGSRVPRVRVAPGRTSHTSRTSRNDPSPGSPASSPTGCDLAAARRT